MGKISVLLFIVLCFLFSSCKEEINAKDIKQQGSIYIKKNTTTPYTGTVLFESENLMGGQSYVSGIYTLKDGIPDGKWKVLGPQGEVFMYGKLTPVNDIEKYRIELPSLKRISIEDYIEGENFRIINIFLIAFTNDTVLQDNLKRRIIKKLIEEKALIAADTSFIKSCNLYPGELKIK